MKNVILSNTQTLSFEDIRFHPGSFIRRSNFVFSWGDGLYRAFDEETAPFYHEILETGLLDQLAKEGLIIPSIPTAFQFDGYPLVVQHPKVPFVSYPFEWSPEMLRTAALLVIKLQRRFMEKGLLLRDLHGLNVLFDGPRPLWIDVASVSRHNEKHLPLLDERFYKSFLNPLIFFSLGMEHLGRSAMLDVMGGPTHYEVDAIIAGRRPTRWARKGTLTLMRKLLPPSLAWKIERTVRRTLVPMNHTRALDYYQRKIEDLEFNTSSDGTDYYDKKNDSISDKKKNVQELFNRTRPNTLLDLGCNMGFYSELAAALPCKVVSIDVDSACLDHLYRTAQAKRLDILPIVMDVRMPSPALGFGPLTTGGLTRFHCEFVLALALVHHLVHRFYFTLESVAELLANFSTRWVCVEFIPMEDKDLSSWSKPIKGYNLENFKTALEKHFKIIEVYRSTPEPRVLIFAERKKTN